MNAHAQFWATFAADIRFFDRRPDRQHRLRLAGPAEIDLARQYARLGPIPAGARAFCAIRRLGRCHFHMPVGFAIDAGEINFDESTAREGYTRIASQREVAPSEEINLWRAAPASLAQAPLVNFAALQSWGRRG